MGHYSPDIAEFYARSQGRMIRRLMKVLLRDWWPDISGYNFMGVGYTLPFVGIYRQSTPISETLLMNTLHPPRPWPKLERNFVTVCDDRLLPIENQRMDRIFVMHSLETADDPDRLLRELWRTLDGNGRIILVVPNRTGVWSRAEQTPFGHGHPYTYTQLKRQLTRAGFTIERHQRALYLPHTRSRIGIYFAPWFERLGRRICPAFGGLLMVEASKQLFAPTQPERSKQEQTIRGVKPAISTSRNCSEEHG
tara:strand:- start:3448 stop:4200 length:753 start_codon:yes stop_codon:yes gene_type:complete